MIFSIALGLLLFLVQVSTCFWILFLGGLSFPIHFLSAINRISGVMVSVLTTTAAEHGFKP